MFIFKENGKPEYLAKNLLKHIGCRKLSTNLSTVLLWVSLHSDLGYFSTTPQNIRLLEDKNFVSHILSKKEKKKSTSICTMKRDRSTIGILCDLVTPQWSFGGIS